MGLVSSNVILKHVISTVAIVLSVLLGVPSLGSIIPTVTKNVQLPNVNMMVAIVVM